jgi:hypothetical protein
MAVLLGLDPETYAPHALHGPDRQFPETNCYTDLWIELLHARGFDPHAVLAFCVAVDFEGDQWTFFKPPPEDLAALYGLEVQELSVYRTMPEHVAEQVALGRIVVVEVDAFYLPDTAGRAYREQHEKSSIAVDAIDQEGERLAYFHNQGFYALSGDDYRNVLRLGRPFSEDVLPPYVEFVRGDRLAPVADGELRAAAARLLDAQAARIPADNPVERFGARLAADVEALRDDQRAYHLYAFATLRQCGAAWDLASAFLDWLADEADGPLAGSAAAFADLAGGAKTLLFKLARASATGRPFDPAPATDELAATWERATTLLALR